MLGTKILEERKSRYNGDIKVVRSLAFGTYIQVDNLTQSGGIVEDIWKEALKRLKGRKIKNVLIVGLGGGSAAKLVRKFWPQAKITGVDIDPAMVEMGKKYLGLDKIQIRVRVQDALEFVGNYSLDPIRYAKRQAPLDLVIVDLYKGYEYPRKFESETFLKSIPGLLSNKGVAVFNRLYIGEKRREVMKFGKKLEKIFSKVEYFYPEANLMFICQ